MIADFYAPYLGGVEVHVGALSRALVERGHCVAVVTLAGNGEIGSSTEDGVHVYRVDGLGGGRKRARQPDLRPWAPPFPDPKALVPVRKALQDFAPDVVHSHDWLGRTLLPINVRRQRPVIHTLHYYTQSCAKKNLIWQDSVCSGPGLAKCTTCAARHYGRVRGPVIAWANFAWSRVERQQADRLIAVSESVARGNGISQADRRCVVIPNFLAPQAPDPGNYGACLDRLPAEPFILFVGDLTRQKGINILLDAYRQTDGSVPLVLIGAMDAAGVCDLPPGVFALGEWPNEAVRLAYERCLFGVVPSAWLEPFGIVLLECMAAGKPVIASRIGGIPEVVEDGETGILVPPFDPNALGDAMTDLSRNSDRQAEMGSRARVRAGSYSAEIIIPRIEAVYQKAISVRSGAVHA